MKAKRFEVYLRQDSAPSAMWVVEIRRMGGRIEVRRERKECGGVARAHAEGLAAFLGFPLVEDQAREV